MILFLKKCLVLTFAIWEIFVVAQRVLSFCVTRTQCNCENGQLITSLMLINTSLATLLLERVEFHRKVEIFRQPKLKLGFIFSVKYQN